MKKINKFMMAGLMTGFLMIGGSNISFADELSDVNLEIESVKNEIKKSTSKLDRISKNVESVQKDSPFSKVKSENYNVALNSDIQIGTELQIQDKDSFENKPYFEKLTALKDLEAEVAEEIKNLSLKSEELVSRKEQLEKEAAERKIQEEKAKAEAEEAERVRLEQELLNSWKSPFAVGLNGFASEQTFGYSSFRVNNFHNGLDFGSMDHPGADVLAVHSGTVVYAGVPGGSLSELRAVVVVQAEDGLNMVYQEFSYSASDILVSVGQTVKTGEVIAQRTADHLHLGFTYQDWLVAQSSAFSNNGVWIDPLTILK